MVKLSARWPHRSRIVHAFGLLTLLGATILVVLVRDPALSSTRLAEPVPAPEITVVQGDPLDPDGSGGASDEFATDTAEASTEQPLPGHGGSAPSADEPALPGHATGERTSTEISRSLFWSGVFGLSISLAGLGLVGTRRRRW
ncbi:hypothetical protein [Micromonospora endophytica]|uniref:Uncharacterized protein n=1 Tax=Micromonospora endophytica TaxID=515350 RepID=A0A2W2DC20_9ACTN|nr:hypothetical protein [Micromonospora endophytica]PZF98399.1 hypothetical protein C1I93_09080 [Micromonospora endophytica]RIW47761.1 hypothetical protein D3H59_09270 [Micromonospora endophytica]